MPEKKLPRRLENLFADRRPVAKDPPPPPAPTPTTDPPAAGAPIPAEAAPRLLGWTWEADEAGRYTFCSPEITTVLGYAPEEILGQALTNLLVEDPLQGAEDSGVRERVMEAIHKAHPLTNIR